MSHANVLEFKNKMPNPNDNIDAQMLNVIRDVLDIEKDLCQQLKVHAIKIEETDKRLETLEDMANKKPRQDNLSCDDYVNQLIKETAEYYKIPENSVQYEHTRRYRENSKYEHDLPYKSIYARLSRIYHLKDIENIRREFRGELCGRLGKTEKQIREEPHIIAIHFNDSPGQIYFPEALELNKHYMQMAQNVLFDLESKYGIYDTDKKHGVKLMKKLRGISKLESCDYDSYERWFKGITKEYARICNTTESDAAGIMFEYAAKFGEKYGRFNCEFTGNLGDDLQMILNDKDLNLRKKVLEVLAINFINTWNVRLMNC